MASESETWWTKNYTSHSIRDLQILPIFNKFISMHFDYERICEDRTESYSSGNTLDVFKWEQRDTNEGETFSHDRKTEVWFYEKKFPGQEAHTVTRTWLSPDAEWGEIERTFLDFSIKESWKMKSSTRHYERCTLHAGEKRGLKTGCLPAQGGMEQWTETYWEKLGESEYEKVWERPGASGGESKHNLGDYWWGEVWHRAGAHIEKKSWHTKGDKEWGHVHGEAPSKVWDEKWDISKGRREEEKLTHDGGRWKGYRVSRNGQDYYKQEWDGLAILGVDEGLEKLKNAEVRQDLDDICTNYHDSLLKSEHTVDLLLREAPEFKGEVEELKKERSAVPKPNSQNVASLVTAIRAERELGDKLERLKQRMIDSISADHGKYNELHNVLSVVLNESQATLDRIAEILKTDSEASKHASEWAKKTSELPKLQNLSAFARSALYSESLQELEKIKLQYIEKLKGGIDSDSLKDSMDLLYQIMVKHDAVSDKIVELVPDSDLKAKLDGFEDQFETIHKKFQEEGDPKLMYENLELLLAYQPLHLHLMGRLRGYNKEEVASEIGNISTAVEETKSQPSLKNTRAKVRSGRGAKATPFQLIDRNLNQLIPFVANVNDALRAGEDLSALREVEREKVDDGEPFEVIFKKAELLVRATAAIDAKVDDHSQKVQSVDLQLDSLLQSLLPIFKKDAKAACEALLARHYATEDVSLLVSKVTQLSAVSKTIKDLKSENEELEMIIEQKSEEITSISTMMDEEKQKKQDLEDEVLELRKKQG